MPEMSAFWAPAGPQPRRLIWGRVRVRAAETAAQKEQPEASPETQKQQHPVNNSILWLGSRAHAKRPENQCEKNKDRAVREPATAKAKRTEQQPTAQHSNF